MIDIIYMSLGFCCGWYLNHMTSRGCSTVTPTSLTAFPAPYPATVINTINANFVNSGLANFTGASIISNSASAVQSTVIDPITGNPTLFVQATTVIQVSPFLTLATVPLLNSWVIPGVTGPMTFNYFDRIPVEETGLN